MTDYDNRKENQAFEHVELLQRQRESAKRAEADKNYEAEQAKREREFQEKVFADCDKWDNRELGADEAYAKKADMRFGAMVVGGEG